MKKPFRNLLLLAALCWVAPASAGQRLTEADLDQWHDEGCPHAQDAGAVVIASDAAVGEVPVSPAARAFFP